MVPLELADELPERYRAYVPHLERRRDGDYLVRPQSNGAREQQRRPGAPKMSDSTSMDTTTAALAEGVKIDTSDPGALRRAVYGNCVPTTSPGFGPEERLVEMARDGVVGEVLIGQAGFGVMLPDDDANVPWARLMNDWMADAYRDHLDQFAPGISIPLHDLELAATEITRAAAMGLRPVLLPELVIGMPYFDPTWEPVWEAAAAAHVPVFLHLSGENGLAMSTGNRSIGLHQPGSALTGLTTAAAVNMTSVGWFVNSGVLERHPGLTVALIECNASWLAFAMHQWDHHWHGRYAEVLRRSGALDAQLEAPPSYYVRRQVKCQFGWDPPAITLRHDIGLDVLMWGNDYPHLEGAWPDSQHYLDKQMAGVPEDEVLRMVHDNAAELLGLSV
jgi:predicted TIM-barrel fold metal-dependent hydrolase